MKFGISILLYLKLTDCIILSLKTYQEQRANDFTAAGKLCIDNICVFSGGLLSKPSKRKSYLILKFLSRFEWKK